MHKSKFFDIVKTFTPEEFRSFRIFIRSPFHNTNKNVIKVVEIIKKYFPELNNEHLLKENVFKKIYPGKKYNDTVMRILISDLLKLSEEYLAYINFISRPVDEKKYLLNELSRRKLNSLFNRHQKASNELLESDGLINISYFLNMFELESGLIDHMISTGRQPEIAVNVLKQGEYLINFFIINIMNVAHELESQRDVLNVSFENNIVEDFLRSFDVDSFITELKKRDYKYAAVLSIYYNMYLSFLHYENDEIYFNLKKLVFENLSHFTREEKFNLFIILESICTSKILKSRKFYVDLMELYILMLSEKIYTHTKDEYFQLNLFRNIFYTSILLKEFDWAESFVNEHLHELQPEFRDNTKHLAYAYISFGRNEFDKSLEEITEVSYNYFAFKFDVRLLMAKIYYEMKTFEPALSLIDTFTHFLSNNKNISPSQKESFGNFLKFLKQLIRLSSGELKKESDEIKKEINLCEKVISKQWLLEKVDQLSV